MEKIKITTTFKKYAADIYTPVSIYLRLRDRFRDTILLESTDAHAGENSRSVIAINAICGIEIDNLQKGEYKFPGEKEQELLIDKTASVPACLINTWTDLMQPSPKRRP
jgi:anthranilate synthase component 1